MAQAAICECVGLLLMDGVCVSMCTLCGQSGSSIRVHDDGVYIHSEIAQMWGEMILRFCVEKKSVYIQNGDV